MSLESTNLIKYTCEECGHTFYRYANVMHVAACPRCAQHPPEDFDYPLLESIIRETVEALIRDAVSFLEESIDGCMDDIISEIRYKLRERKKEKEKNAPN